MTGKWPLVMLVILIFLILCQPALAQKPVGVLAKMGDIYLVLTDGRLRRLTSDGKNSQPALSLDKKWVVFTREISEKITGVDLLEGTKPNDIWLMDTLGKKKQKIASGYHYSSEARQLLASTAINPQFSLDGQSVLFQVGTGELASIEQVDLKTRKVKFICRGEKLKIIPQGRYQGYLIVRQPRNFLGNGGYCWYWLMNPAGKEIGAIGDERRLKKFEDSLNLP